MSLLENLFVERQRIEGTIADATADAEQAKRSGYGAEAQRIEKIITALQDEHAVLTKAIAEITEKETARRTEQQRSEKHAQLVVECRQAKEKAEESVRELERARAAQVEAENAYNIAEGTFGRHQQNLLTAGDYPTEMELEIERETGRKLRDDLEAASAKLRAAKQQPLQRNTLHSQTRGRLKIWPAGKRACGHVKSTSQRARISRFKETATA